MSPTSHYLNSKLILAIMRFMKKHPKTIYMDAAINDTKNHIKQNEGGPFGACIVCDDQIIAVAHNTVLKDHDSTCHAEINAIRIASKKLNTHDLGNCVIYATTEPCPMCFSAIHWANIKEVIYGTKIPDVQALGFRELEIDNETMKKLGKSDLQLTSDFDRDNCLALLNYWKAHSNNNTY